MLLTTIDLALDILVSVVNISNSKSFPVGIEQKMATFWFERPTVKKDFVTADMGWKAKLTRPSDCV